MTDSLIIGESIELIGAQGGIPSVNPLCTGAVFLLMSGFDLGAPVPVTSVAGSLLLDGSRPFGYQASNRAITMQVQIRAPSFQVLTAAREVLLREIDQQTWTLRWTRDTTGPLAGNTQTLPLLFDCFRAHMSVNEWGGADKLNRVPTGLLTLSFDAMPYARSDQPVTVDFPAPLSGRTAPPAVLNIDTFASVSGAQWAASALSPVTGGQSAFWDPTINPANIPTGALHSAAYSATGLSLNTAAGWTITAQGTAAANNYIIVTTADAAKVALGDQLQLWNHAAGTLLQTTIFTVSNISAPAAGFVNVYFTPAASAATVLNNVAIQTAPPQLPGLTFWAGFGSTLYWKQWAKLGGRVQFAVTLTDTYGTVLSFSRAYKAAGSAFTNAPRWHKIRMTLPYNPAFDYANVTAYSITVTNRGTNDLRYTQLYLSALQAVPAPVAAPGAPIQRGAVYDLAGIQGSARSPVSLQFQQPGTTNTGIWFTRPGTFSWLCPPGVTSVSVVNVGGGGAGAPSQANGGGGGGGGGSGVNGAVAVTAGNTYTVVVGAGGIPGGAAPGASTFTGNSVTVTGPAGVNATTSTGAAGGAAGAGGFAGGAGGAGTANATGGGGGGGGSGGSAAIGNTGAAASAGTGGAGGAAVTFGGSGGRGGTFGHGNGTAGVSFGGGSGGSPGGSPTGYIVPGSPGMVSLNYALPKPFQSLLVHRPPLNAPESLSPVLPVSIGDPADGSVVYTLQALHAPGLNARFGGTYTVAVVASSWTTPASSRTITVTITQLELTSGASYTATVAATLTPNTLPNLSGVSATYGPIVMLGELTLPLQDLPLDNTDGYFTASITDTITTDAFSDILFLDTQGSTVMILSPTAYANMYVDEPAADRDLGLILGSIADRGTAVSVLDRATVTGGPITVNPEGNPYLLAYCAEGAPNMQIHYFPRWFLDRYQ